MTCSKTPSLFCGLHRAVRCGLIVACVLSSCQAPRPIPPEVLDEATRIDRAGELLEQGLHGKARIELDALSRSSHPQAALLQARLRRRTGDSEGAIPWCERAIAADAQWFAPRALLFDCFIDTKRLAAAESLAAEIGRMVPESPWGPYVLASLAAARGEADRATTLVTTALAREADHQPALRLAARLAALANQPQREEDLLLRLIIADPHDADVHLRLASLAERTNRLDAAQRHRERAYDLDPSPSQARALADLARKRGDLATAATWAQRAGDPAPAK